MREGISFAGGNGFIAPGGTIDGPDLPNLLKEQHRQQHIDRIAGRPRKQFHGDEFPGEDAQAEDHGNLHDHQADQIAARADFERAFFLRLFEFRSRGSVDGVSIEDIGPQNAQDTADCDRPAPAVLGGEQQGEHRKAESRGEHSEVAQPAVDSFGQSDFARREPFTDEADAHDESGTDATDRQTKHDELPIRGGHREEQARYAHDEQQRGEDTAGTVTVDQHSNTDAGRNGQSDVTDEKRFDLLGGQVEDTADGAGKWRQIEPHQECQKECAPGEMEHPPTLWIGTIQGCVRTGSKARR